MLVVMGMPQFAMAKTDDPPTLDSNEAVVQEVWEEQYATNTMGEQAIVPSEDGATLTADSSQEMEQDSGSESVPAEETVAAQEVTDIIDAPAEEDPNELCSSDDASDAVGMEAGDSGEVLIESDAAVDEAVVSDVEACLAEEAPNDQDAVTDAVVAVYARSEMNAAKPAPQSKQDTQPNSSSQSTKDQQPSLSSQSTKDAQPKQGTYALLNATASNQLLDIKGGAVGGRLITYRSNSGINQRFVLSKDELGRWHIASALDGREVGNASKKGVQALLNSDTSAWRFEPRGSQWLIRSLASNLVLGVSGDAAKDSAMVVLQQEAKGLATQLWKLVDAPSLATYDKPAREGYYRLVAPSGKTLDVRGSKDASGTQLIAYATSSGPNQVFKLVPNDQGFVRIFAGDTKMVVSSGSDLIAGGGKAVLRKYSERALDQLYRMKAVNGGWELRDLATGRVLGLKSYEVVSGNKTTWKLSAANGMIKTGLFEISLTNARTKRIEVRGASLDSGTAVFQWGKNSAQNQKWDIVSVGNNLYTVQNVRSGLYLSQDGRGRAIQSSQARTFRAAPLISGWGLVDVSTGKAIAINNASNADRASVVFRKQNGYAGERFAFTKTTPLADGTYAIELVGARRLVVGTKTESYKKKTNVQMGTWAGSKKNAAGNQKWLFVRNSDGTYTILNAYSGLALDASGSKPKSGANVAQWTSGTGANQRWLLRYDHKGGFDIVNAANKNLVLTAAGTSSGKNVSVSTDVDKNAQSFAFAPTQYTYPSVSGDAELDGYIRAMIKKYGTGEKGLFEAYRTIGNLPYRTMNVYPQGPWKSWSTSYAKYMYKTGTGNCYRYASLICWYARGIGYDCRTVSGEIILGGSWAAHGWVEVKQGGKTLVLDTRLGCYRNRVYGADIRNSFLVTYAQYPYRARVVTYA